MNKINEALAKSCHDVVNLQETWYNGDIDSNEIIAGTNYTVIRADRSKFDNSRKVGGGVASFIKGEIDYETIEVAMKTTIEFVVFRITLEAKKIIVVNVYIPPYRQRMLALVVEFSCLMERIRSIYIGDEIIVFGDFNLSHIKWQYRSDNVGSLSPSTRLNQAEEKFVEILNTQGIFQVNPMVNSRGSSLDLILASDVSSVRVSTPQSEEMIDGNSIHHNASMTTVSYLQNNKQNVEKSLNFHTTNLRQTNVEMINHTFDIPGQHDIDMCIFEGPMVLIFKIIEIIECFRTIQNRNTKVQKRQTHIDSAKYPWTRDNQYQQLLSARKKSKSAYINDQNEHNKRRLKMANIALAERYNLLKVKYYEKMLADIRMARNDGRKFFKFIKTKKTAKTELPATMLYENQVLTGNGRLKKLCDFFESCYTQSSVVFPSEYGEFKELALDIYRTKYSAQHENLWTNYLNWFTIDEVISAINSLDNDGLYTFSQIQLRNCCSHSIAHI